MGENLKICSHVIGTVRVNTETGAVNLKNLLYVKNVVLYLVFQEDNATIYDKKIRVF